MIQLIASAILATVAWAPAIPPVRPELWRAGESCSLRKSFLVELDLHLARQSGFWRLGEDALPLGSYFSPIEIDEETALHAERSVVFVDTLSQRAGQTDRIDRRLSQAQVVIRLSSALGMVERMGKSELSGHALALIWNGRGGCTIENVDQERDTFMRVCAASGDLCDKADFAEWARIAEAGRVVDIPASAVAQLLSGGGEFHIADPEGTALMGFRYYAILRALTGSIEVQPEETDVEGQRRSFTLKGELSGELSDPEKRVMMQMYGFGVPAKQSSCVRVSAAVRGTVLWRLDDGCPEMVELQADVEVEEQLELDAVDGPISNTVERDWVGRCVVRAAVSQCQ